MAKGAIVKQLLLWGCTMLPSHKCCTPVPGQPLEGNPCLDAS